MSIPHTKRLLAATSSRLIAASVVATLAISLVAGTALAKQASWEPYEFTRATVDPPAENVQWDAEHSGSFAINSGSDSSPADMPMGVSIGFDWDSSDAILHCGLVDRSADAVDDNGSRLVVEWAGVDTDQASSCYGVSLEITATWYYDTHLERSTYKDSGWLLKVVKQVDSDAVVHLTVVADDETIIDDFDAGPVGTYETGEGQSRPIGKP